MTIGQHIRKYRELNGYTAEEFGKRVGLSRSYISWLETQSSATGSVKAFARIVTFTGMSRQEIYHYLCRLAEEDGDKPCRR